MRPRQEYDKKYRQIHRIERAKYERIYYRTFTGRLVTLFSNMKRRCNNPKHTSYKYYGGRNIKCLFKSSREFINYIINDLGYNTYEEIENLQIDRIDNNGHYEQGNIRFVTAKVNANNRRKRRDYLRMFK